MAVIGGHLRSYDLIVRLGGDEFLRAMSNMTLTDARQRFTAITTALAAAPQPAAIRAGFARLAADDSATDLIALADKELIDTDHDRREGASFSPKLPGGWCRLRRTPVRAPARRSR